MKRLIYDDYIEEQVKYEKKHGKKTTILMQVGGFFELYASEEKNKNILDDVASICNFQISRKDKKKTLSRNNPYMAGFPLHALDKYIFILLNHNYTVVLIEQVTSPPDPERKVTNIYSPGTIINHLQTQETNHLMSVYIEHWTSVHHRSSTPNTKNIYAGISIIDLSTGTNHIYETYSKVDDKNSIVDEIYRSIKIHNPVEIIFTYDELPNSFTKNEFIRHLEITLKKTHFHDSIKSEYKKKMYQNQFLKEIFSHTGLLTPIEYLDLETKEIGLVSYIILLNFAYSHNETIIKKISKPILWDSNQHLILTNNSIEQLDVISTKDTMFSKSSLFSIINNTSTALGRRLLKEQLLNPIREPNVLNKRYSYIEELLEPSPTTVTTEDISYNYKYQVIESYLSNIRDLERLHRKMSLCMLEPFHFVNLDIAYSQIIEMIHFINQHCKRIQELLPSENDIHLFKQFIEEYKTDFDMDEIGKYNVTNITSSFFNKNRIPEIDKIQEELDESTLFLQLLQQKLSDIIEKDSHFVKLTKNEKDGYYFSLTYKRSAVLKKKLSHMVNHPIKINFLEKSLDKKKRKFIQNKKKIIKIKPNDITFSSRKKSECIIQSPMIETYTNKIFRLVEKMKYVVKENFLQRLVIYDKKYMNALKKIVKSIAQIDVIKSNAKTSIRNNYSKPIIKEHSPEKNSFLDIKQLRHPIIEKIQSELEYVPNDITLGLETSGMLLYGTNASGKSSFMKSIGLNLIMAQAGMYVAAKKMVFYPYHYLFTRIRNNDNLFRGQSSFAVEMSELRAILKRADAKSVVLGDELCSGTETYSALSIFATSVHRLTNNATTFVFATHLHELCNLDVIKNIDVLTIKHLKVLYQDNKLIYDRKLENGPGPAIYGLEVCKAMHLDDDFLTMANSIRKQIMMIHDEIKPTITSKYNTQLYLQRCFVCGDTNSNHLETHHIQFQCTADKNDFINHIHKNHLSNLVSLCNKCHIDVHNKDLEIYGYIQTTDGIELSYKRLNKIDTEKKKRKRKKYNQEQLQIIEKYKEYSHISKKDICFQLLKKHQIKISVTTLNKILTNQY